jgi:hypothetical protein
VTPLERELESLQQRLADAVDRRTWAGFAAGVGAGLLIAVAAVRPYDPEYPSAHGGAAARSRVTAVAQDAEPRSGDQAQSPSTGSSSLMPPPPMQIDFANTRASPQARRVAHWVAATHDHAGRYFAIVDKKSARLFVFDPAGTLQGTSPVLLGAAIGDDSAPGVGDKPVAQVRPEERTTPAGRFVAEPGRNASGEEVVWVDYDNAVSMHRVRATVRAERRLQRLATPTVTDNRISYGCINVPSAFYNRIVDPTLGRFGGIVYVLPEVHEPDIVFGAPIAMWDSTSAPQATTTSNQRHVVAHGAPIARIERTAMAAATTTPTRSSR